MYAKLIVLRAWTSAHDRMPSYGLVQAKLFFKPLEEAMLLAGYGSALEYNKLLALN